MFLTEDKLSDWINTNGGLLITRRTMNMNTFDYKIKKNIIHVCITGYKNIIELFFEKTIHLFANIKNIILIIIESDVIELKSKWLDNPKLKRVYCWNKPFKHEKLKCIPIGLNHNRQYNVITEWLKNNNVKELQTKKINGAGGGAPSKKIVFLL